MEKTMNLILALYLSVLCAGCGVEVKDKGNSTTPEQVTTFTEQTGTFRADDVSIQFKGQTAQRYQLVITWPSVSGEVVILSNEKNEIARVNGSASTLTLDGYASEKIYDFIIEHYDKNKKLLSIFQRSVTTPRDLVLSSQKLNGPTRYEAERIFLLENTVITVEDHELVIEAQEIISNNATIQSFPVGAKTEKPSGPGRSGGKITLKANKGQGHLQLLLRGEGGGHGLPGLHVDKYSLGCPGGPGGNGGDSSALVLQIKDTAQLVAPYLAEPGPGGRAGERNAATEEYAYQPPQQCVIQSPNPSNGQDGKIAPILVQ
jgi:hypothetical protein